MSGNRRAGKSRFSHSPTLGSAGHHSSKVSGWEESQVLGCHFQAVICYGKLQAQAECLWLLGVWLPATRFGERLGFSVCCLPDKGSGQRDSFVPLLGLLYRL